MVRKMVAYSDNEFCAYDRFIQWARIVLSGVLVTRRDSRTRRSARGISRPPQLLSRRVCQAGIFSGSFISNPDVRRGFAARCVK